MRSEDFVTSIIRLMRKGWCFDKALLFCTGENWTPAMESHIRYLVKQKLEA